MPIGPSPYYSDPQIGQIASNLAIAIMGDPDARAKRDYYGSEVRFNDARTAKTGEETTGIRLKNDATRALPDTLANLFAGPGTPAENFKSNIASAAGILTAAGGNAEQQVAGLKDLFSTAYGLGGDADMTRSLVLDGKMPDQNFAASPGRADNVASRNAGFEFKKDTAVEGMRQAGANTRNAATIAGQNERFYNTPLVARPGTETYLAPSDPRFGKMGGKDGVVRGVPTKATVQGAAGQRIMDLPADAETPERLSSLFGAGNAGASGKPRAVTRKSVDDAVIAGARGVNGALDLSNPAKPVLNANFEAAFDPAKVAAARQAAADELARSGDVQRAGAAYQAALGVKPGDTFEKQGGFMGMGGTYGVTGSSAPDAPQPSQGGQPVRIQGDADYARLPPGTSYMAPDGSVRTKR